MSNFLINTDRLHVSHFFIYFCFKSFAPKKIHSTEKTSIPRSSGYSGIQHFSVHIKYQNGKLRLLNVKKTLMVVHKRRHGLRGEGASRILRQQNKSVTMGEGCQKLLKLRDVIYGRPLTQNHEEKPNLILNKFLFIK
jgi:hypothetical protein